MLHCWSTVHCPADPSARQQEASKFSCPPAGHLLRQHCHARVFLHMQPLRRAWRASWSPSASTPPGSARCGGCWGRRHQFRVYSQPRMRHHCCSSTRVSCVRVWLVHVVRYLQGLCGCSVQRCTTHPAFVGSVPLCSAPVPLTRSAASALASGCRMCAGECGGARHSGTTWRAWCSRSGRGGRRRMTMCPSLPTCYECG